MGYYCLVCEYAKQYEILIRVGGNLAFQHGRTVQTPTESPSQGNVKYLHWTAIAKFPDFQKSVMFQFYLSEMFKASEYLVVQEPANSLTSSKTAEMLGNHELEISKLWDNPVKEKRTWSRNSMTTPVFFPKYGNKQVKFGDCLFFIGALWIPNTFPKKCFHLDK